MATIAEHSIIREFAAARPDAEDRKALKKFAISIKEALKQPKDVQLPGNNPYKNYKGLPYTPDAGEDCIKCGICAKKCPVGAISEDNPLVVDETRCITCMRCVYVCPKKARSLS